MRFIDRKICPVPALRRKRKAILGGRQVCYLPEAVLIEQAGLSIGATTKPRSSLSKALASPFLSTRNIWSKASLYFSGDGFSPTAFTSHD